MLTAENIRQCDSSAWTAEGRLKGQHFQPRSTDIIVSGGTKSGSTWLQQIIHQLHTGGDMDFGKLFDVPIVEFAHDLQQDLEVEQKGFPR